MDPDFLAGYGKSGMFGNLLGGNSGGRNKPSEDSLVNVGPITMFNDDKAAADFPNMLQPLGITATVTQGDQLGNIILPAPPPLPPNIGGGSMEGPFTGEQEYLGNAMALLHLCYIIYNPATIDAKLSIQLAIDPGEPNTRAAFRYFVFNVQRFRVYLALLGGQLHVTMVHTPGMYY